MKRNLYDRNGKKIKEILFDEITKEQYCHQNNYNICSNCKNNNDLDIITNNKFISLKCPLCNGPPFTYLESELTFGLDFFKKNKDKNLTILNIGAGIGILEVFVAEKFPNFTFIILDRNNGKRTMRQNFNKNIDNFGTRCDVKTVSKKFIESNTNNISNIKYVDYDELDKLKSYNIDVIYSSTSWCFHYGFDVYSYLFNEHDIKFVVLTIRKGKEKDCKYLFDNFKSKTINLNELEGIDVNCIYYTFEKKI